MQKNHLFQIISNTKKMQWVMVVTALLIYANSIPNKWAIDDTIVVQGNKFVKRGIAGFDGIFNYGTFYGYYGADIKAVAGDRYRPLTLALFALEASVFASTEKDANGKPVKDQDGYVLKDVGQNSFFPNLLHLFNILFYAALCLLLYHLLLLLFNRQKEKENHRANFIAFVAALLFTVHPLHTEAVANVKGLDEVLSLFLALVSMYSVLKMNPVSTAGFHKKNQMIWPVIAGFSFLLGLLAKESVVSFLVLIPLTLWFFTNTRIKKIIFSCLPLLAGLLIFLGLRHHAIGSTDVSNFKTNLVLNDPFLVLNKNCKLEPVVPGSKLMKVSNPDSSTFVQMPAANRLATNLYTYARYGKLLVVPWPLTFDYYPRHIGIKNWGDPAVLLSLMIHLFLIVWSVWNIKKRNPVAYGILFYGISFSLVSNLFFPIGTNMAERFMFMPSLGICLAAAVLLYKMAVRFGAKKIWLLILFIAFIYSAVTIIRNPDWKDNYTLLSHDVKISKHSGKVTMDLLGIGTAIAVNKEREALEKIKGLPPAAKIAATTALRKTRDSMILNLLPLAEVFIAVSPTYGLGWQYTANAYRLLSESGKLTDSVKLNYLLTALESYKEALKNPPVNAVKEIMAGQGLCYKALGKFYLEKTETPEPATGYFEASGKINPADKETDSLLMIAQSRKNLLNKPGF
jgi:hypothetical protein